jgi:hypothetical protein
MHSSVPSEREVLACVIGNVTTAIASEQSAGAVTEDVTGIHITEDFPLVSIRKVTPQYRLELFFSKDITLLVFVFISEPQVIDSQWMTTQRKIKCGPSHFRSLVR